MVGILKGKKAEINIKTFFVDIYNQNDELKKENQKLVNKENKVKEIYLYNFK